VQQDGKHVIVYTTCPSLEVAAEIGRVLVECRQAACVNILPQMISVYVWNNQTQRDEEVAMLVKTQAVLSTSVIQTIKNLHPYEVPAVLVLPVCDGSKEFTDWITEQTSGLHIR